MLGRQKTASKHTRYSHHPQCFCEILIFPILAHRAPSIRTNISIHSLSNGFGRRCRGSRCAWGNRYKLIVQTSYLFPRLLSECCQSICNWSLGHCCIQLVLDGQTLNHSHHNNIQNALGKKFYHRQLMSKSEHQDTCRNIKSNHSLKTLYSSLSLP